MKQVVYGKTGKSITRLGFGVLRLPSEIRGKQIVYDEEKSVEVIRHAIDAGINYLTPPFLLQSAQPAHPGRSDPGQAGSAPSFHKIRHGRPGPAGAVRALPQGA